MSILCMILGHKVRGDNWHGHYCERCDRQFDWGIFEKYCKPIPKGTVIRVARTSGIKGEDLE